MTQETERHVPIENCPMCGGKCDYNWDEIGPEKVRAWYIHCAPDDSFKGCVAHDGRFATLREAITHWNTRAALSQPSVTVEELANLLEATYCEMNALCGGRIYFDTYAQAILSRYNVTVKG